MIRTRGMAVDAAAALGVLALCGFAALEAGRTAWWQSLLVVAVAVPVVVRRRWPLPAAVVTLAASGVVLAAGVIPLFAAPGLVAAVALTQFPVGSRLPPSRAVPELIVGLAGAAALGPAAPVAAAAVTVPWLAGLLLRHRRHLAEQVFEERTARAVAEERLRIARDVHDTAAHSLSMIVMKASVARHVAGVRPEEGLNALEVIETAGRQALVEMRRTVGLLRAGQEPGEPSGGEQDLRALADGAGQAGVRVTMTLAGTEQPPPGVRLVVFRIVQEALTNVVRHARAGSCTVSVEAGTESVTVRVADDGGAPPDPAADGPPAVAAAGGGGHGLRGMRERVTAHGGTLLAGPRDGGGFAVTAHIPYSVAGRGGQP